MATSGQGLSFGDFEDLSPEENERIFHILHGQKSLPSRVEFPWDGETEDPTGEDEGKNYYMSKDDMQTDSGPHNIDYPAFQEAQFSFGSVQVSELSYGYGMETRHIISFDDTSQSEIFGQQPENAATMQTDRNTQSKLQASLKPYERRNKKKRPPDYYKEQNEDSQVSRACSENYNNPAEPVQQEMMSQSGEFQGYGTGIQDPTMTYSVTSDVHNTAIPVHGDSQIVMYQPVGNEYITHPNQALTYNTSVPSANVNIISNNFNNQQQGELQEIVVDSNNTAYTMPARTETYQIQDHIRTNSAQNIQFGNFSSVGSTLPTTVTNEANSVNQINRAVSGQNVLTVDSSALPGRADYDSSSQQQSVHSVEQFDTRVNVTTVIPDNNIPGDMSQTDTQSTDTGDTAITTGHGNEVSMEVNHSVTTTMVNVAPVSMETDSNSTKNSSNSVQSEAKPKLTWAGLFKHSSAPNSVTPPVVSDNKTEVSVNKPDNDEVKKADKEFSPVPVPAKDDSIAKELGELLSQMTISHASVALQPRGLVNKGNWCYINGTLQALVACPPLYNLLKKMPKYPALSRGPSSTPILDSLVEFVHEFHPMQRQIEKGQRNRGPRELSPGPPFEPSYVYKMLQAIAVNPHFKLGKQEDAEEFLSCILDGTHEEMAAAVNLTNKQSTDSSPTEPPTEEEGFTNGYYHADEEEEMMEEENWEQVGPKKKSVLMRRSSFAKTPIADIFAGMIRSGVYKASAKETATLEPFFTLQLDIQSEKVCSVRDALEGLVSKEIISGYTDPKTNQEVEVVKKLSLEELPPVLILHLKFFVYNKDGGSQKLMKKVDYPVELEITKDLLSPNARNKLNVHQRSYKLFAVVYHHGKNMTGGHYTTCVFHPGINGWVLSDDSTVKTVPVSLVLKYSPPRVPYLLYYRRLDSH